MSTAFINYRRSDTQHAAQALNAQLNSRFGPTKSFLDVGSIPPGAIWPTRIQEALANSSVVLSLVGRHWLSAVNEYFQRKLDDPKDWVRSELVFALSNCKPIVPILVAGAESLPPPAALPSEIQEVLKYQSMTLRDDKWDRDLEELLELLRDKYGFIDIQSRVVLPRPLKKVLPLTTTELECSLKNLEGWESVDSIDPEHYPKSRQELRKVYEFKSFKVAVGFMNNVVPEINKLKHHPRWENQWKTVTVYLSTWDIGNRVSSLDIELAYKLDYLYSEYIKNIVIPVKNSV